MRRVQTAALRSQPTSWFHCLIHSSVHMLKKHYWQPATCRTLCFHIHGLMYSSRKPYRGKYFPCFIDLKVGSVNHEALGLKPGSGSDLQSCALPPAVSCSFSCETFIERLLQSFSHLEPLDFLLLQLGVLLPQITAWLFSLHSTVTLLEKPFLTTLRSLS